MFYNDHDLLTYKRLYNLIIGIRGHGKTYDFTKRCIEVGLKQKKVSFVVLARYKEDVINIRDSWWTIVEHLFPDYEFFQRKNIIYAKTTLQTFPIGEYVSLSQYIREKRKPRPYVKYIFFDEFLNEDNNYLSNEISAFLSVCDSIIRNRDDVRVILVSNTITMINPYFNYFGFLKLNDRFTKGLHNSILEFTDSEEFAEYRKQTKFGSSIVGTRYGDFAIQAKFMLDDMTNVSRLPEGQCKHQFNIALEGHLLEVCMMNNLLYIRSSKDYSAICYTPYVEDAKNIGAIFCNKNLNQFEFILNKFLADEIMYESLEIKNTIISFVRFKMGAKYKIS